MVFQLKDLQTTNIIFILVFSGCVIIVSYPILKVVSLSSCFIYSVVFWSNDNLVSQTQLGCCSQYPGKRKSEVSSLLSLIKGAIKFVKR